MTKVFHTSDFRINGVTEAAFLEIRRNSKNLKNNFWEPRLIS